MKVIQSKMKTDIIEKHAVNVEEQTITFSCASDLPYERYDEKKKVWFDEVLTMDENAVDQHRLKDGASLLFGHDPTRILGVITGSSIIGNKLFVTVAFRRNDEFSSNIFADILDGRIKNVSIGYSVNHWNEKRENGRITRYVDDFLVYEVSIVGVPADETVGIRSLDMNSKNKEKREMTQEEIDKIVAENEALKAENETLKAEGEKPKETEAGKVPAAEGDKPAEGEAPAPAPEQTEKPAEAQPEAPVDEPANGDENEIKKLAKDFDVANDVTEKALASKMSVKDFKMKIKNGETQKVEVKMSKEKNEVRDLLINGSRNQGGNMTLRTFSGFGGQTGENGASLIGTETLPLVAMLAKNLGLQGYRTISGLRGNVSIPCQTANPTVTQAATLRTAATATTLTMTPRTLAPVKFAAEIIVGKELIVQSNDDIVSFVVDSLTSSIAYKLESYMLGKVSDSAPKVYIDASAITWAKILEMESKVSGYALRNKSFVVCPAMLAALKGTEKATGTAQFLCSDDGKCNGYPVSVSGCISDEVLYFGDFSRLILGIFGEGLEIVVDPFTQVSEGNIKIVGSICADAVVEHDLAFAAGLEDAGSSSQA